MGVDLRLRTVAYQVGPSVDTVQCSSGQCLEDGNCQQSFRGAHTGRQKVERQPKDGEEMSGDETPR